MSIIHNFVNILSQNIFLQQKIISTQILKDEANPSANKQIPKKLKEIIK